MLQSSSKIAALLFMALNLPIQSISLATLWNTDARANEAQFLLIEKTLTGHKTLSRDICKSSSFWFAFSLSHSNGENRPLKTSSAAITNNISNRIFIQQRRWRKRACRRARLRWERSFMLSSRLVITAIPGGISPASAGNVL